MKKRLTALLLAVALCIGCYIPARADMITDDNIIEAILVVFRCKEGTYDSVNRNDNGALSIGKLQWHAGRALDLMKNIVSMDSATAFNLLGESLYYEIVGASRNAWNSRVLNPAEGASVSALLGTEMAMAVQDATGRQDILSYMNRGRDLGITTPEALVYYCDLENQYGSGGAASLVRQVKSMLGKSTIDSLEEFHTCLLQATANYHSRRIWTYEYCSSLDWSRIGSTSTFILPINLDLQPPEIKESSVRCLNNGAFAVELKATDDRGIADVRVAVNSDVETDKEWAGYALREEDKWLLRVPITYFDSDATHYYITATVSDESGNGTSTNLQVSAEELLEARRNPCSAAEGHLFVTISEREATCTEDGSRMEQCCECYEIRQVATAPARGHDYATEDGKPVCTLEGQGICVCKVCGSIVHVSTVPEADHKWLVSGGHCACVLCGKTLDEKFAAKLYSRNGKVREEGSRFRRQGSAA